MPAVSSPVGSAAAGGGVAGGAEDDEDVHAAGRIERAAKRTDSPGLDGRPGRLSMDVA